MSQAREEAMAQARLETNLMNIAKTIEDQVDAETKRMGELDEDDLDRIRQKRIEQMKKENDKRMELRRKGHGQFNEINSEEEFFQTSKESELVVCHFYRTATPRCQIVDKHLAIIASKHVECRFVKLNAEKTPFLVKKLLVVVLPSIALIRFGKIVDWIVGFDDLGGQDDFETPVLEWRIASQGMVQVDYDVHEGPPSGRELGPRGHAKSAGTRNGIWQKNKADSDDDDGDMSD
ncbi:thioredoxin domain-containing protein 9-like protein [Baffinella frigidus]|nr:thioredoxin domain-containing protein 9-like protein [Cryptophyta sp. CCMP2293]|mmetsp:Transcript_14170/g.34301  ORF Transcript_14170/g.34301 Transcript_14170/m.34301 type:complete len:234 (+) Transcript_14170:64-765(+)|eukprot:CAMPEP_0180210358 /NCGR_PEP_ID=MMETSP0987-20121128/12078_1 /TAXON_ID=697907 /ORGANISM="non described non described, Strain CCMP2293" /LENGTH=233 /DNA_ID=CAMNT_0022167261 /DNA_START=280 /DNA_END=981 /DNA_ORIENTATION=-